MLDLCTLLFAIFSRGIIFGATFDATASGSEKEREGATERGLGSARCTEKSLQLKMLRILAKKYLKTRESELEKYVRRN